jgi:predicted metalloprotease with PDZ domain
MQFLGKVFSWSIVAVMCCIGGTSIAAEGPAYKLDYSVTLLPEKAGALVKVHVDKGQLLHKFSFSNERNIYSDIRANGKLTIRNKTIEWELPEGEATLSYFVTLTNERSPGKFDSRVTNDWALFRGDDLIPAVHTYEVPNAYSIASLSFTLPKDWKSIETGWDRKTGNTFAVDNPERRFDRPTGWMIAGKVGTRRATVKKTKIAISAPAGEHMRRMDALTFFNFVWPELHKAFEKTPQKLLVVGAGDPMWRGGLSASNSLFLHSDRPLVSENGTSPLLHELTHMVTRISGKVTDAANDDWIAEGLAEFYSFELLYRADGMTKSRRAKIIRSLSKWGGDVKHLRKSKSTGPVTARAVVLLNDLDQEIRKRSKNKYSIDDVVRELMKQRKVSLEDLTRASEKFSGSKLDALNSVLLK